MVACPHNDNFRHNMRIRTAAIIKKKKKTLDDIFYKIHRVRLLKIHRSCVNFFFCFFFVFPRENRDPSSSIEETLYLACCSESFCAKHSGGLHWFHIYEPCAARVKCIINDVSTSYYYYYFIFINS